MTPTVTIDSPEATDSARAHHQVTATVASVDGSPAANASVTFSITAGPDTGRTETHTTDAFGRATFQFTNNCTVGTDTVEAALEGKGTATVICT